MTDVVTLPKAPDNEDQESIVSASLDAIVEVNRTGEQQKERYFILETVLDGLIEVSFIFDFISDCSILY